MDLDTRSQAAIQAIGLTHRHGGRPVLDGVDFAVPPGAVVGLLGRAPCGCPGTAAFGRPAGVGRPVGDPGVHRGRDRGDRPSRRRGPGAPAPGRRAVDHAGLRGAVLLLSVRASRNAWARLNGARVPGVPPAFATAKDLS